jgi:dTDP-4-amino-4,6-dideoxygalactose transaminase
MAAFSFHETKNIISGEGGMLVINDEQFAKRAEIIREKGTNRSAFFRGEVDKYGWVDIGSSFLPSDIIAAFLYAQIENIDKIQARRKAIWEQYFAQLKPLQQAGKLQLPCVPEYAANNAHMFYVVCKSLEQRSALIEHLKTKNISAVFHYLSLHKSPMYRDIYNGYELSNCDNFSDTLVRLPFYFELSDDDVKSICEEIISFYQN